MLAMKENIGIGSDFAERMFRRFHDQITSSRYARLRVKLRRAGRMSAAVALLF
jgi:hypothetical protein